MKLKGALFIVLAAIFSLLPACSASRTTALLPETTSSQPPTTAADLPIDLPTYFLPQQNPVGLNPAGLLGTVYVSDKDYCFHRQDCSKLGRNVKSMSRTEAKVKGYTSCPVCNP